MGAIVAIALVEKGVIFEEDSWGTYPRVRKLIMAKYNWNQLLRSLTLAIEIDKEQENNTLDKDIDVESFSSHDITEIALETGISQVAITTAIEELETVEEINSLKSNKETGGLDDSQRWFSAFAIVLAIWLGAPFLTLIPDFLLVSSYEALAGKVEPRIEAAAAFHSQKSEVPVIPSVSVEISQKPKTVSDEVLIDIRSELISIPPRLYQTVETAIAQKIIEVAEAYFHHDSLFSGEAYTQTKLNLICGFALTIGLYICSLIAYKLLSSFPMN
ncbi:hypothetical protein S7335_1282 [Synechococcus sp. PCC 7335]|uniref:hypothetical protein n=2 Tax=Synechococcus sp. (strain ATCC 29403 / PCC 7335) TaxID=91464 RepID=UPI00017EE133|nr:hypothetical protein [Synechococcus sp. PCC 7335]EDX82578.1 hypothetical protein S7335_1282 [Synechococcus sp. PCC 7335]